MMLLLILLFPFIGFWSTPHRRGCRTSWSLPARRWWPVRGSPPSPSGDDVAGLLGRLACHLADGFTWIQSGDPALDHVPCVDPLSPLMILVITGIGSLIHIYATGVHARRVRTRSSARYFSYLEPVRGLHARPL